MNKFIEIESRHGRLFYINVDQIICIDNFSTFRTISLTDKDDIETFESYESIKTKIDKDIEVVGHGYWIQTSESKFIEGIKQIGVECSACKIRRNIPAVENHGYYYCPNCGAKMDGERKTDNDR